MGREYDDDAAAERYSNPENLTPGGPARRVRRNRTSGLSSHVPVRFSADVIAAVKRLADLDGVTVSTWIRSLVTREVERRRPRPRTDSSGDVHIEFQGAAPTSTRAAPSEQSFLQNA
jgi:hypothetical protein